MKEIPLKPAPMDVEREIESEERLYLYGGKYIRGSNTSIQTLEKKKVRV